MNSKIVKNNINNNHSAQPSDWRGYIIMVLFAILTILYCSPPNSTNHKGVGLSTQKGMDSSFIIDIEKNIEQDTGKLDSLYSLGEYLFYEENNYGAAYQSFEKASNKGNKKAMLFLGCEILNGVSPLSTIEKEKGVNYLRILINNGNVDAIGCLSNYYYKINNIDSMLFYLSSPPALEDNYLLYQLGYFYISGKLPGYINKEKYNQIIDTEKGVSYLKKSSTLGNINSQYFLGSMYMLGKVIDNSNDSAIYYFEMCLKNQDPEGTSVRDQAEEYLNKIKK